MVRNNNNVTMYQPLSTIPYYVTVQKTTSKGHIGNSGVCENDSQVTWYRNKGHLVSVLG